MTAAGALEHNASTSARVAGTDGVGESNPDRVVVCSLYSTIVRTAVGLAVGVLGRVFSWALSRSLCGLKTHTKLRSCIVASCRTRGYPI